MHSFFGERKGSVNECSFLGENNGLLAKHMFPKET